MYKHGDLMITTARSEECVKNPERCWSGHIHEVIDSRRVAGPWRAYLDSPGLVALPPTIGPFVIGGADQIRAMMADLQAALTAIESMKGEGNA